MMGRLTRKLGRSIRRTYDENATPRIRRYVAKGKQLREKAKPAYHQSVREGKAEIRKWLVGTKKTIKKEWRGRKR